MPHDVDAMHVVTASLAHSQVHQPPALVCGSPICVQSISKAQACESLVRTGPTPVPKWTTQYKVT